MPEVRSYPYQFIEEFLIPKSQIGTPEKIVPQSELESAILIIEESRNVELTAEEMNTLKNLNYLVKLWKT